jgi:uncharacterized protein
LIFLVNETPVLITLRELELHRITVSKTYAPGSLDYHTGEFQQVGPLRVDAVAELVGSEIRIRGHLGTRLEAHCDRCLGPVRIPVEQDFDLFYRPMSGIAREEEIEIRDEESEIGFYSGDGVELADVLTEQVNLGLPMKLICRPDCLGLCPVCGGDRNVEKCQCSTEHHESPFDSLKRE